MKIGLWALLFLCIAFVTLISTCGTTPSNLPETDGIDAVEGVADSLEAMGDATPMMEEGESGSVMTEGSDDAPYNQSWVTSSPTGYVNVREWGSIHAPVVAQINNGNVVTTDRCDYAAAENKTWCRSSVNGVAGWIGQVNLRVAGSPDSSF